MGASSADQLYIQARPILGQAYAQQSDVLVHRHNMLSWLKHQPILKAAAATATRSFAAPRSAARFAAARSRVIEVGPEVVWAKKSKSKSKSSCQDAASTKHTIGGADYLHLEQWPANNAYVLTQAQLAYFILHAGDEVSASSSINNSSNECRDNSGVDSPYQVVCTTGCCWMKKTSATLHQQTTVP